jgi:hypothetical protein
LKVGEGVGVWIDPRILAALDTERRASEGYSEVILRLVEVGERGQRSAMKLNCVTSIVEIVASERQAFISGRTPI